MRYREFGRTGMEVSAIGTGTWAISGVRWGPTDDRESVRGIQRAVDLGVTLFDTVDVFGDGRSEELLGDALRGRRHGVRIITKGGINFYRRPHEQDFTPSYLDRALGESLRRLRTDYIDVYMLHSPTADALAESDLYDFLERLQGQGRLLAYGASVATVKDATRALPADFLVWRCPITSWIRIWPQRYYRRHSKRGWPWSREHHSPLVC